MSTTPAVTSAGKPPLHDRSGGDSSAWCPIELDAASTQYVARVSTSLPEIEALRSTWKKWVHSLDADVDYFVYQVKQDPAILRPHIITVYNEGMAHGMLIGQIRRERASSVVSFVSVPGPMMNVLEIKKGGRIGQPSGAIDRVIAMELLKSTRSGEVDSVCLERLPLDSALFREIQKVGFHVKQRVPHIFRYSTLSLRAPQGCGPQVFSGKQLREVRRKTRNLERVFPGQVTLRCFSGLNELSAGMCDAMRVAVTTWQYCMGVGLTDTARTREALRFFAWQGWLRIYVLYIAEKPCAFLVGQLYNDTFSCQFAGYHPRYSRYSVGSLITARAFEELAAADVQWVDLGEGGGQEHNRRLGCQTSDEGTVHIYSPTLSGLCANLFFWTMQMVRKSGSRTRSFLRLGALSKMCREHLLGGGRYQPRQNHVKYDST